MMKKLLLLFTFMMFAVFLGAQSVDDYQSAVSGDWNTLSTWEKYDGFFWQPADVVPSEDDNITIQQGHQVTLGSGGPGAVDLSGNLVIEATGGLDMTGYTLSTAAGGTLLIESNVVGTGELICNGTPAATVKRYIYCSDNTYWHQIGVPVSGATADDIFQDNAPDVWMLEWFFVGAKKQTWDYITETSAALSPALGYIVTGDYSFTIDWNGPIRTSSLPNTIPADYSETDHFGIIGNPFTASLDVMSDGTIEGTNLTNQIWTWDPLTDNYATYTSGTGGTRSGIVASGQSFFVQIADGAQVTTFDVNANDRVLSTGDNFLKKSGQSIWDDNFGKGNYVMLKVLDGEKSDAGFVNFGEYGTPEFENGYDGTKMFGEDSSPKLYFVENELELSIDYLKTLDEAEERIIQMNFKAGTDGEHTIAANLDSLESTRVTLEDIKTGLLHEFNSNDQYTFNASVEDAADRFLLHFLYSPTGISDPSDVSESSLNIYAYNKAVYISNTENTNIIADISIYDIVGRQIYSNQLEFGTSTKIPVNVDNTYLIVKVVSGSNVITQKVFVQ